jgi:capsular exopolysaccharide synthesis family protein
MAQNNNPKIETSEIPVAYYLKLVLKNWHWFALSMIICGIIAGLYIMITPKIYERTVQIMLKEDAKRDVREPDETTILKDINLSLFKANINNEIEVLLSEKIIKDVVKKLHLEKNYEIRSGLKYIEIYNETPIVVQFIDMENNNETSTLFITLLTENKIKLTRFEVENIRVSNTPITASISDTINTPLGRIIVSPTLYYEDFINKSIRVTKQDIADLTYELRKNITITKNNDNTVIKLSFSDESISRAEDILNTLVATYDEDNITYRNQVVMNTSDFINERLRVIERDLGTVDQDISKYKSNNMITDIKESSYLFLMESSRLDQQLALLQNQLSIANFIKEYLNEPSNNSSLIPSNSGIGDQPVEKQISDYNALMLKRNRLIENSSEKSPSVIELTNTLTTMRQTIIQSVNNLIVVYELQVAGIKEKESQTNQKITNVPEKEMDIISIERRLKIQENLYLYLLQKREENELTGSFITSNFKIVNSAGGSNRPIYPQSIPIMLVALIAGFLIPCTTIFVKEIMSTKIKNVKDIADNISVPFLGVIPQDNPRMNTQKHINPKHIKDIIKVKNNNSNAISEAFRIVRTNIGFMETEKATSQVIMLTSFNEQSGKSFVSLNLAITFALAKKKTVLIDLNLRKATLSSYLHEPKTGIVNYLDNDNLKIEDILIKEPFQPNLDVIPVGNIPNNPVEILLSNRLNELIATLRENYDHIIIDTTPFNIVADASIIKKLSDMTIFILKENLSDRCRLDELENLHLNKINNMTVLLNGSRSSELL